MSWNNKIVAVPSYSAGGEMTSVSYPAADATHGGNGTQVTLTTDAAGQAAGVSATGPGGALITSDAVSRSQDGRVLTDTVDGAASPTFSYTYDDAGRLVTATEPNQPVNYGFGATTGCGTGSGVLANPGLNSDRTTETITPTTGTPTTYRYCYGTGDQLLSSTDPSVGTIAYNAHGDTTSIHGETHTYDALDQHTGTTKGATSVTYVRDKQPGLLETLDELVWPETRGHPMSPLRWTLSSTYELARQLTAQGFKVSAELVRRLLHEMGYSPCCTTRPAPRSGTRSNTACSRSSR